MLSLFDNLIFISIQEKICIQQSKGENIMKNKILQYKEIISYIFFGGCTTLVNIVIYYACSYVIGLNTVVSTIVAWILSVVFAYITNKIYVFESDSFELKVIRNEIVSFFGCRIATGIMDLIIMVVFVDWLLYPDLIIKIISNILVILINYIASKLFIFNSPKK